MTKAGRNDPCPCGSGLKYKKCCGDTASARSTTSPSDNLSESGKKSGWINYPARSYEKLLASSSLPQDLEFWTACSVQFGSPVLCFCCGNGREMFHLADKGIPAVGVDVNDGLVFLGQAKQRELQEQAGRKLDLEFIRADIVTMQLGRKFPLAILATQSFQLILTASDQQKFLENLREHLNPGGVFIFNISVVTQQGNRFVNEKGERIGSYATDLDPAPRFLIHGPLYQRLSTLEEVSCLLKTAGFEVTAVHGPTEWLTTQSLNEPSIRKPEEDEYTIIARRS